LGRIVPGSVPMRPDMDRRPWYETLFAHYARRYDAEPFTQGTEGECAFIDAELGGNRALRILDVGCGTGRHAIRLAGMGYPVTGIDLSEAQILRAREKAAEAGVEVDFRVLDARDLPFEAAFDAVIMICEGGFALMETDEENFAILQGAVRALRPGGLFLFTTLNGLFPLFHSVERHTAGTAGAGPEATQDADGPARYRDSRFDLMTFRDHNTTEFVDDDGVRHEVRANERYFVPSEITWWLKSLGCTDIAIHGARLGAFSREHALRTEDFEMLVTARKAEGHPTA
jgi:2-polyprenyl-3-methyl-5-hydroxy-6-metoxy-1,4-benzoquinol methylase